MELQELELSAYGYRPVSMHDADTELHRIYEQTRTAKGSNEQAVPHLGQVIIKTVAGCNFSCKSESPGLGYECYEYVTDDWKEMPPLMSDEVAWQTGMAIGAYAAQNTLPDIEGVIHGGEPLFVPKDPDRPGQKAAQYYDRILPLIRQAVSETAPDTRLSFAMQTNGSLLTKANLDMLRRHDVRVGVSMDGPQAAHDFNRVIMHNGRRIGTHRLVERGLSELAKPEYASIYGGIICVMDLRSDPLEVLAELQRFKPPRIEIHLPYATWEDPPAGIRDNPLRTLPVTEAMEVYRTETGRLSPKMAHWEVRNSVDLAIRDAAPDVHRLAAVMRLSELSAVEQAVPYAAWFLKLYNANKQQENPLSIRLFSSMERLILGGATLTEAIGPNTGGEIVVRTDGSIELPDSLRMTRSGSEKTMFNVFEHDLEHVAAMLREQNHLGKKSVPEKGCASCDLQQICGGGHIATRFSNERGFDNPSVYCADLEYMIRAVKKKVVPPQHIAVAGLINRRRIELAKQQQALQYAGQMFMSQEYSLENF